MEFSFLGTFCTEGEEEAGQEEQEAEEEKKEEEEEADELAQEADLFLKMAPPSCAGCGGGLTRLRTDALQSRYGYDLNYKWHWHTEQQAYWFYCLDCHNELWSQDFRSAQNRC